MGRIIGIDLGTTNSEAAVMEAGQPRIIASAEGNVYGGKNFPSVVGFSKDGEVLVGDAAKRQAVLNPERTVLRIKRKMGQDYSVTIDDKKYTPQEISALILRKIKHDAEQFLGEPVTDAVITVPAYFDDNQRQATKDAGKIAGLHVQRLVNEPTAAALAYGLDKDQENLKVAVYDLGGGTFDITIMEMGGGVFQVLSTNGDTHLGGTDMDDAVVEHLAKLFQQKAGIDVRKDRSAMQRLRDAAERAKMELTAMAQTTVSLPFLAAGKDGPQHLETTLNRAKLEELIGPIVERTRGPCEQALKDAKLSREQVDRVLLVGGPTRIPLVQQFVERLFGKKPVRGVDPMQCVALGAAVQGGILSGEVDKDIVLLDVTPLTLGVEVRGGIRDEIIARNTTIPHQKKKVYSTAAPNQPQVEIHVLQGERPMARDNKSLGRFILDGIPPAPAGIPQIEVTFDIDTNGILHVTAKDLGTGKHQKITISGSTKLNDKEVERMRREAEEHAAEDARRREQAEARNGADQAVLQAENLLREANGKLGDHRPAIEAAVKELKETAAREDASAEQLKAKTEALHKALEPAVIEMYRTAGAQAEGAAGASGASGAGDPAGAGSDADAPGGKEWSGRPSDPDDVVDADYREKGKDE